MTMAALHQLSNLQRLNLLSIEDTVDTHFIDIANHLPSLQHLKVLRLPLK